MMHMQRSVSMKGAFISCPARKKKKSDETNSNSRDREGGRGGRGEQVTSHY